MSNKNIVEHIKKSDLKKQHLTDDEDDSYDSEANDEVVDDLSAANMQVLKRKAKQ